MDLIYADGNLHDLGVLQDYSLDMEYGADSTNDFEVKVQKYNHVCDQDYILYIEFTEYGGVIDRIESNTGSGEISYKGRTWHGILNSFVIEPPAGQYYRTYNGDANDVLAEIIELCGLSDLFLVDSNLSNITIRGFQSRYEKAYDLIMHMLNEYNAKMYCYWKAGKVHIGALLAVNYATNEEFDSSQVPFKVGLTYNNYNHMVCLGQGVGVNRAVIHLFCDEGGAVQPYTLIDNPLQDSDYILDKRNQVLFGREERTEIFDEPNAEIITNYIPLVGKPSDWEGSYYNYYKPSVDSTTGELKYEQLERKYEDEYWLQETCPDNWYLRNGYQKYFYWSEENDKFVNVEKLDDEQAEIEYRRLDTMPDDWVNCYGDYYEYDSIEDVYKNVESDTQYDYDHVPQCPVDWEWTYSKYFVRTQSGTGYVYSNVQGRSEDRYPKQETKPSDWESNWGNYYTLLSDGGFQKGNKVTEWKGGYYTVDYAVNTAKVIAKQKNKTYPKWVKGKFYNKVTDTKAPLFSAPGGDGSGVYNQRKTPCEPTFVANKYYKKYVVNDCPVWESGKYYTFIKDAEQIPLFEANAYYYAVKDRFAMLIQDAAKRWTSLRDTSTLDIDLELTSEYDVGDVVGSIDNVTKIEVNKMIKRKIIKIRKDIVSVEYNVD